MSALAVGLLAGCVSGVALAAKFERFYAGGAAYPQSLVTGPDGAVWFTWEAGIGRLAPDGSVRLHRIATATPQAVTVGPDGALWFTDELLVRVGRFALDGTVSFLSLAEYATGLNDIATGPDGALWVSSSRPGRLLRLAADGGVTVAADLGADAYIGSITAQSNGDVWFAAVDRGIGLLTVAGEVRVVHRGEPDALNSQTIAAARDGTVWGTVWGTRSDWLVHLETGGMLGRVRADAPGIVSTDREGMTWFEEANGISRLDPRSGRRQRFGNPFGHGSDCGDSQGQFLFGAGMAFTRDGAAWASDWLHGSFVRVGPAGTARSPLQVMLRSREGVRAPHGLVAGRRGTVWVTGERSLLALPRRGGPRTFAVPGEVGALALGPDGRPWFSIDAGRGRGAALARLTAAGTVRTLARLPRDSLITAMESDATGALWFTDLARRRIGRIGRARTIRYITSGLRRSARPYAVAVARDRTIWVTDSSGAILRIDRSRRVRRYPLPDGSRPLGITEGPDGAMWFADPRRRRVARITRQGALTEFPVEDRPVAIAAGSDGAVWVTTTGGSGDTGLVRVTTSGDTRLFYVRQACVASVRGLISAPDGSLLFTVANGPVAVGRLDLHQLGRTGQFADAFDSSAR